MTDLEIVRDGPKFYTERERERERERDRQTDRQTKTDTQTHTHTPRSILYVLFFCENVET